MGRPDSYGRGRFLRREQAIVSLKAINSSRVAWVGATSYIPGLVYMGWKNDHPAALPSTPLPALSRHHQEPFPLPHGSALQPSCLCSSVERGESVGVSWNWRGRRGAVNITVVVRSLWDFSAMDKLNFSIIDINVPIGKVNGILP